MQYDTHIYTHIHTHIHTRAILFSYHTVCISSLSTQCCSCMYVCKYVCICMCILSPYIVDKLPLYRYMNTYVHVCMYVCISSLRYVYVYECRLPPYIYFHICLATCIWNEVNAADSQYLNVCTYAFMYAYARACDTLVLVHK